MQNKQLEREIMHIISRSPLKTDVPHALSTRRWVLKLRPDADYALQISALAHDIERAFQPDYKRNNKDKFDNYNEHKRIHSEKSAKIIIELLKKYDLDKKFISKVKKLVLRHEFGGDPDSDLLKEADNLSIFEQEIFQAYLDDFGQKKTRQKIKISFNRLSEKGKLLVMGIKYDNPKLNLIFKEEISY